jgi:tetratricopeptide (TPR) repeat protein
MSRRQRRTRPAPARLAPPAPPAAPGAGPPAAPSTPPLAVALVAAALLAAGTAWFLLRPPALELPDPASLGLDDDPAVAAALGDSLAALRRAPDSPSAWGTLGFQLAALGRDAEAAGCFRDAARRDARSWRWPYLAGAATRPRSPGDAEALFGEGVRRDPGALWPRLARAETRAELGRFADAGADFEAVLAVEPDHARARLGLARSRLAGGDAAAAREAIGSAADHPATRRAARLLAGQIAARSGDDAAARRLLAEAAALPDDAPWPDDPLAAELPRHALGKQAWLALLRRAEAEGATERAAGLARRLEETYPEVWFLLEGKLRASRGDAPAALEAFRRALAIDPGTAEVHWELARLLAAQGRTDEAVAAYRRLVQLEPAHGPAWRELGRHLLATDRRAAIEALRRARDAMPASEEAREALRAAERGAADDDRHEPP